MNILYISFLNGDSWAGPTYSVPKQIGTQAQYDNVFWYNIRETKVKEWRNEPYYHDLSDYPNGSIHDLPSPFNSPDIIVVEQFYGFAGKRIIKELEKGKIPYVIIPRGELTCSAQKRKHWKKVLANALLFYKFSRRAAGIQYLTEQEKADSGDKWNKNSIVIPNGITAPCKTKTEYCNSGIRCIAIGRIEPYHKGLDMLIEACGMIANNLRKVLCTIDIFGPDYDGKVAELKKQISLLGLEDIIRCHEGLYGEDKERELLNNDVFLLTSRFEGHPMALIEALSYGLPCVVTRGSNMKDEVEKYHAGWTAENDVESIKDALLNMIENKSLVSIKGKNAIILSEQYRWDKIAQISSTKLSELCD